MGAASTRAPEGSAVVLSTASPWTRTLFAKAAAILVAAMALVAAFTALVFSRGLAASFCGELDERGRSLLRTLERHQDLHLAVVLGDAAAARRVLAEVLSANADARYLAAVNARGEVLAAVARGGAEAVALVWAELPRHGLDGPSDVSSDDVRRFTQAVLEESAVGEGLGLPGAPAEARRAGALVLGLDATRLGHQANAI